MRHAAPVLAVVLGVLGAAATLPAAPARAAGPSTVAVVACKTAFGAQGQSSPPIPTQLAVMLDRRVAPRVRFYSDGFLMVLAPRDWSCAGVEAADGGQSLSVFPPGHANPLTAETVVPTAAAVTALVDYTGHGPGAQLVCALFPGTRAARLGQESGGCSASPPRETVRRPQPDIARFVDPPGVHGSGEPSGGKNRASGAVIYPQLNPEPDSVIVAKVTCTTSAATTSLCPPIIDDFVARLPSGAATPR